MYQRILVPVDESEASHQAVEEACKLAKALHATVRLLHVVDLDQFGWGRVAELDETAHRSIRATGDKILDQAVERARQQGVRPESHAIHGWLDSIPDLLLDEARAWQAELIVLGTHGRSGLKHLLIGSVAEGVLKQAPVPVLLVRNPC